MADQKQTPNLDSVNPLFNKMDALMARHRNGPAASMDDIPVLTDVAPKEIPSLFDIVDDIPALTDVVEPNLADKIASLELEWQIDHEPDISHLDHEIIASAPKASALEIEPLPFQKTAERAQSFKSELAAPAQPEPSALSNELILPVQAAKPALAPNTTPAEFIDLPMLDLDELTRAPAPDYLELPVLSHNTPRDLEQSTPTEHFIATDLVLSFDELATQPAPSAPDFAQILAETSLAADEIPHLDLDAILSVPVPDQDLEPDAVTADLAAAPIQSNEPAALAQDLHNPQINNADLAPPLAAQRDELLELDLNIDLGGDLNTPTATQPLLQVAEDYIAEQLPEAAPLASHDALQVDNEVYDIYLSEDDEDFHALDEVQLNLDQHDTVLNAQPIQLTAGQQIAQTTPSLDEPTHYVSALAATPATLIWDDEPELVIYSKELVETTAINLDEAPLDSSDAEIAAANTTQHDILRTEAEHLDADANTLQGIATETSSLPGQPAIPHKINSETIEEITASVGAQLAIDVATEIEQLTKQHFSALMNQFYGETLRKLTEEISRDLEERLAPRIAELVETELRSKKLLD